jgi:ribosomal-protein-alanine N-acetyltransferase
VSAVLREAPEPYAPMSLADLDEVVQVESEIYPFPWTHGNFADALAARYSAWVLRGAERRLQAYAIVMPVLDEAHLLNLSVARGHQGAGLGFRTLRWVSEVARDYGARSLLLEVRPSNAPALRLYDRYGFQRIGLRRDYYPAHAGREDAIVMRIAL